MEIAGAIIEIMKCFGGPTCRYIDYHRKLEKNVGYLRSKVDDLNMRRQDIESRKDLEIRTRKVVNREVEKWLEEAKRVNIEMQNIEHKFCNVSYFSRSRLGKLVCQQIKEVERIYQQGKFTEGVAIEGPPTVGLTFPTTSLEGEIDVKEQIWKYLMDDDVGMIGVCGMGGIGKTTIMKHINNQLVEGNQFNQVIWVTVSKELSIYNLQEDMARAMKIEHDFPTNVLERAAILKKTLEQKRYVLILDDVWERFPLLEVGIIEATLGKERKVVLTSRSIEVCISMGCNVVKVQPLSKGESMNLFLDHVGCNVQKNRGLEDIVEKIVEQCSGLPLAIATIGSSMKGEDDISEWRNALKELQDRLKSVKGSDKFIFEQLKFSYDRLKDYPNIQNCFLYCSLYPEDYAIEKVELIESWIDEGFLVDLETRQAMHDRGHSILNKLVNNCLLERVWTEDFEKIKMHDVLRDMALTIKTSDHFMVKAGSQFIELPDEHEWKMPLEKVSFINNSKLELPSHLSPKCHYLTTLLFQGCVELNNFSEPFFMHLPALKVLNLSYTAITHLPNSISFLKNLRALILVCCKLLRFVPSLAELRALRKLDLLDSNIQEVPQGIEFLENLTYLGLGSQYLKELHVGITSSRISHLQYLIARDMHLRGEEVGRLRKLEVLACKFCDMQEYKNFARLIQGKFPTNFYILVGSTVHRYYSWKESASMLNFKNPQKHLVFRKCEMEKIDDMIAPNCVVTFLNIDECDDLICLNKNPLLHKAKELKNCNVSHCKGVECVVDLTLSSCSYSAIHGIEKLTLYRLRNLGELVRLPQSHHAPKPLSSTIFTSLRELSLFQCQRIEILFTHELLQGLHSLESIEVKSCEKMEKIFGEENMKKEYEGTTRKLNLPKLKSLTLCSLPRLKSICCVGIMIPAHLQFLHIADCLQLKRIPLCLPLSENRQPTLPPCLKKFKVWPREWWDSIELDDPSPFAKDVLSRFLVYINEAPRHVQCLHHSYRFPKVFEGGGLIEAACSTFNPMQNC